MRSTALLVVMILAFGCSPAHSETPTASGSPVVLELFTSQGCSSCPPADALLTRLASEGPANVIPLAFHVDYWNYIGWTDPFSSATWSQRQQAYATFFHENPYTPQLVVNGTTYAVGSDEGRIRSLIAKAAATPPAGHVELKSATVSGGKVTLDVSAFSDQSGGDLIAVVYETSLSTPVKRGENGGRTLHDDFVVRRFQNVAKLGAHTTAHQILTLELDPTWARPNLGVAVFLQDPSTHAIASAVSKKL
jgi:hypothetical protein